MNTTILSAFLLRCLGVNYAVLLLWFLAFVYAHSSLYQLHTRWFHLSEERFDALHYGGMMAYKIGILLFNLAPYLALRLL